MASKESEDEPVHSVMTLFAANSDNILLQDTISCNDTESGIAGQMPVGLAVPHVYFTRQTDSAQTAAVNRTVLRDFAGLEGMDPETTTALLDFSYHLACNNTDEAYKSVKNVQSHGVWESMSKMCVKTGRLDVAQKCLGQMGHARAASALRACVDSEPEAKLAIIAVHLDMVEDAEALYKKCGRFDLLNLLYQACGEWDKALEIAKTKDRVHLKPTHYSYAQHLEALEDVEGALRHFELSGTYRTESPRLLCQLGLASDLEEYVNRSEDAQLHRWYAQYLESKSNLEGASQEYHKAEDWLSLCRVACFNKDINEAMKICKETQNAAACYHLARHLEADGMVKEAIQYFQKAGRLSHALRLAQENNFDGDLMSLALASDPVNMAQAAKYYEQRGHPSKAVQLYQKAGHQKRALELCFSAKLFDALRKIAGELSADSDPEVLARCAEFFMEHSQHDKAVHLLSMSHQFQRAIDLCTEKDVHVTEEMAEKMTPDKSQMETVARAAMLEQMAKLCRKQGSFQLACKKFTQAGDKLKAMKCLLKSGDTEKIIFFAVTARQPDIYVLAGNYLQSLDWHNEPEIMKNIIQFYSKAKAHEKLAAFYDACAQVEIDEFRDYEKAGNALREALKYLVKAAGGPPASETDKKVLTLNNRIAIVDKFAGIRKLAKSDPEQMVSVCEKMLDVPEIETAVRIGDIFAQLVEHYAETQQFQDAHRTVERMRTRRIILTPYLDHALLQTIYGAVGAPVPEPDQPGGAPMPAAGGAPAVEEDVHEDIEDEDEP
jgi:intraflagellar transport protein 140